MTDRAAGPGLVGRVARLLAEARQVYADDAGRAALDEADARLRGPLRVAIAGRVKAGKSTLLNAMVGQELAATDASECTLVPSWYVDGTSYRVEEHRRDGSVHQLPFRRRDGALEIGLAAQRPEEVDRLVVTWPSPALRRTTLIDTPGIGSVRAENADRSRRILAPGDADPVADAVVYLMRHAHADDLDFLEAFRDGAVDRRTLNTVAVLSRADEIGHGRCDALSSAARVAERYRGDPRVRALCQTVLPVAGLLAATAASLREPEYRALAGLATWPELDRALRSARRFCSPVAECPVGEHERALLLSRYGVFGVRFAVTLLREGRVASSTGLARALRDASGLGTLVSTLSGQFLARSEVLKARSALATVDRVVRERPPPAASRLAEKVERVLAGAHEFAEITLVDAIRRGGVRLPESERDDAERLLGGSGLPATARLGLPGGAGTAEIRSAATAQHDRWARRVEAPGAGRERTEVARAVVRTCEGILAGTLEGSTGPVAGAAP